MAATNSGVENKSQKPSRQSFQLFSSTDDSPNSNFGFGFFDATQAPSVPLPASTEVLPSEVSSSVKHNVESVTCDGVTLLKGRVNTHEVFGLSNSDLVPGKYEGGLKLWEGSLDLIRALNSDIRSGHISFVGKRVLEVGCGHGLPGIFALLKGAAIVHFQDFNAEVLRCVTIPNLNANLSKESHPSSDKITCEKANARFFAGDWSEVDKLLPHVSNNSEEKQSYIWVYLCACIFLMIYIGFAHLFVFHKQCLHHPDGVVYMAAKKYYFGVGGGSRRFLSAVEKDGVMTSSLVAEIADGSSNVREVWKLSFK
ncbi:histidine protein methyltransferase 1-like protein isoform X5 [Senna tora]|uniref:protein-histidine N-methyltransferase n=1 Tax=Senna tora TaxID=362788 RepID=A0A834X3P1_9FABA|nr:histidine protein methyltransferase 1-like protein isoform X5 [Senna tora]